MKYILLGMVEFIFGILYTAVILILLIWSFKLYHKSFYHFKDDILKTLSEPFSDAKWADVKGFFTMIVAFALLYLIFIK